MPLSTKRGGNKEKKKNMMGLQGKGGASSGEWSGERGIGGKKLAVNVGEKNDRGRLVDPCHHARWDDDRKGGKSPMNYQ